jgi:hypothetical protein
VFSVDARVLNGCIFFFSAVGFGEEAVRIRRLR